MGDEDVRRQGEGHFAESAGGHFAGRDFIPKKSPYPKTHHPAYTAAVKRWLSEVLEQKDSILYEFLHRDQLMELMETNGKAFRTPWFGQLMTGPQLLAYLAQIHYWFETYRIDIKA